MAHSYRLLRQLRAELTALSEDIIDGNGSISAGRLMLCITSNLARFEREWRSERIQAGLARARQQGKILGRRRQSLLPEGAPHDLTVRAAAKLWGCSKSTAAERLLKGLLPPGAIEDCQTLSAIKTSSDRRTYACQQQARWTRKEKMAIRRAREILQQIRRVLHHLH